MPHKQAIGLPQQNQDHQAVHNKTAEFGDVVFTGHIGNAQQQGRQQGAGNAAGTAHGHHDQKVDHELERKVGVQAQHLGAHGTAQAGQTRAHGKGRQKHHVHIDAQAAGHPLVVHRGTQAASKTRFGQHILQGHRERSAHGNDEQPVMPHPQHPSALTQFSAAFEEFRQLDNLL